jgi:hypothetical protein
VKVDDLIGMFGRDRSVQSIRRHVLDCRDEIVPITSKKTHTIHFSLSDYAEAIVFDLVNPAGTRWRLFGRTGQTGLIAGNGPLGVYSAPQLTRY